MFHYVSLDVHYIINVWCLLDIHIETTVISSVLPLPKQRFSKSSSIYTCFSESDITPPSSPTSYVSEFQLLFRFSLDAPWMEVDVEGDNTIFGKLLRFYLFLYSIITLAFLTLNGVLTWVFFDLFKAASAIYLDKL